MGFLSNLKGYLRRASTPKKETNYTSEETTFGDIEVRYIHSVLLNKSISNIILEISFSKNNKDANDNLPNQYTGVNVAANLQNVDIKHSGLYSMEVILDGTTLGTYEIYVKGKNESA